MVSSKCTTMERSKRKYVFVWERKGLFRKAAPHFLAKDLTFFMMTKVYSMLTKLKYTLYLIYNSILNGYVKKIIC